MKKILSICLAVLCCFSPQIFAQIPTTVLVQISKAEDELRFDKTLEDLMKSNDAKIRARAALASGRIGKDAAITALINLLEKDADAKARSTAAFAIGEIESIKGADAILTVLQNTKNDDELRARAVEAAGKIAAANAQDAKAKDLGKTILDTLQFENNRGSQANRDVVLLGITAVLRAKPESGDTFAAIFLTNSDGRIRADAANTLSRLRAKNANEKLRTMLLSDKDAIARANAARALGAAEDKEAFNLLLEVAVSDKDSRVRVSAIRSLGSLKDANAANNLLERGEKLLTDYKQSKFALPVEKNELLEIATTLGRILPNTNNKRAIDFIEKLRESDKYKSPETEIAAVRMLGLRYSQNLDIVLNGEGYRYFADKRKKPAANWQVISALAQGMGEFSNAPTQPANEFLRRELVQEELKDVIEKASDEKYDSVSFYKALPDVLRAYAQFKVADLPQILREHLGHKDIIVRVAAAGLLGEQPVNKENVEALKTAFTKSLETDKQYNDAQLAILSALVKLDKKEAIDSLKLALDAPNFLVRRHAAQLIKQNDLQTSFQNVDEKVGTVKSYNPKTGTKLGQVLNTNADYVRAVSRKNAKAILTTEKGTFTIEFPPETAPLTVDNFIKLAKAKYFDGLTIHRVVPNFVMQDGDPRGDGNGGPGWEIRDEINIIPFERGTVGMALSGKDTGGSQWFVTHAPQPHLDGGYTVFGHVGETDMKIVDNLTRGDKILSVKIIEGSINIKSQRKK
ncbi:MAG: peptidylprolyl isomerase [Acidobacteriota bacterium]|nr:peptidylprolyl isomerase [Acidobacteriota bacterium]